MATLSRSEERGFFVLKVAQVTAVELKRRLITLIYAGRNRSVMIRRELPRTEIADWALRLYRTEDRRILLFVCPSAVICAAFGISFDELLPLSGGLLFLVLALGANSDVPDEAQQFTPHRGHGLILVLACRGEFQVTFV